MADLHPKAFSTALARRRVVLAVVLLAAFVRLFHLLNVYPTPLFTYHLAFRESDMYMFDQWARRIVDGDVLGREVHHPLYGWQLASASLEQWNRWYGEDPVFYKAPFYPYLIALLYRLFGEAMLPLALLQIGAAALSTLLLFEIGERLFDEQAGLATALLYALYGPDVHYDVIMLRGPFIVLVSLLATWQMIELRDRPSGLRAVGLGFTVGWALVVNEGFMTLAPFTLLALAFWFREARRLLGLSAAFALGMALAVAPVAARNLAVGVSPLKLAVTGGTVYAVFNSAQSNPYFFEARPASFIPVIEKSGGGLWETVLACLRSFPTPAEAVLFYLRKASGLIVPFENPDNASVYYAAVQDPLLRILPGYALLLPLAVVGLVLGWRRRARLLPLLPASLSLFASIMLTLPLSRYRATWAVYLMPFAGFALAESARWLLEKRWTSLAAAGLGGFLVFSGANALERRFVFEGGPADYFRYRPNEFWLGANAYAREGRYPEAIGELMNLVQRNPDPSARVSSLMFAARLHADQGKKDAAREALDLALLAGGNDPGLLLTVGDLHRNLLHDEAQAIALYQKALALHPPEALVKSLRERLGTVAAPQPLG